MNQGLVLDASISQGYEPFGTLDVTVLFWNGIVLADH